MIRTGNAQVDQILADSKYLLLKKRNEALSFVAAAESYSDSEYTAGAGEESATMLVSIALPEERQRITDLLSQFPEGVESKTNMLASALQQIWQHNPDEKIVIFATYLGTVEAIKRQLDEVFPVRVLKALKGGDHGAKTAAQKRFRRKDGPKILVCTAAGREGINLQFARILFNYDLPWNPWIWNNALAESTAMVRYMRHKFIISLHLIPLRAKYFCCLRKSSLILQKHWERWMNKARWPKTLEHRY